MIDSHALKLERLHREFSRWTKISQDEDGAWSITCRKGLWSVHGMDFHLVYDEARYYFRRHHDDGEYASPSDS